MGKEEKGGEKRDRKGILEILGKPRPIDLSWDEQNPADYLAKKTQNEQLSKEQTEKEQEHPPRPSWDDYFMAFAELAKGRSTCLRRHVGAAAVKDNWLLAIGYNGAPRGLEHCDVVGCERARLGTPSGQRHELCRGAHAESNLIAQAAFQGISLRGATVYTQYYPCSFCAKLLINSGINRIVYKEDYDDDLAKKLFEGSSIKIEKYSLVGRAIAINI